jgi:hypothetical protein
MENGLLLTSHTFRERNLCLHPGLARKLGINKTTERQICFGSKRLMVEVRLSDDLPENKASLSTGIMNSINIPDNCHFDIYQRENEIHIGPFIGLLAGYSHKSLKNKLDDLYDYVLHYRDINGIIIAFSLENIDKKKLTVEGYVFNPLKKRWEKGTFPYPSSIFVMTSSVGSKWIRHFKSITGNSVFNDFYFNKWEIQQILAASFEVKEYLPESILYKSPRELHNFLRKFPNAIVKSKSAYGSSPHFYFTKEKNDIVLSSPSRGVIKKVYLKNKDQAYSLFDKYLKKGEFFVQELVDSKFTRKVDFRLIMVKNQHGHWKDMGLYAKQKISINDTTTIYPMIKLEKQHLVESLPFSDLIASVFLSEIYHIAHDAVTAIEKTGVHFANTAIDMTIDEKGRIRILDIDHYNPSHEIALVAGHPEIYYEALKNNMLYAKNLAGFSLLK